jgi:hypothetical protein
MYLHPKPTSETTIDYSEHDHARSKSTPQQTPQCFRLENNPKSAIERGFTAKLHHGSLTTIQHEGMQTCRLTKMSTGWGFGD